MANNRSSNQLVTPEARAALDQLKYEVAQELGIQFARDGYHGNMLTKDTGRIGGNITRRLVQMAEQQLAGQSSQAGRF
ncbi:alpha/beta-type small acid-soluble spore protein [Cohnella terricola]|uniref:Alpha/beta-type small acid-soluble spore protein n=1 Tax=Cohnella terricola TaxID=1289167 RepID=A0A559JBV3_9BACL|nr:alpha/beta-type small acid-soluble spore protein [Cohnella terricola]TVX97349.1 alpha/beta-type small acid-soluble spore protein [Cohnella terricola]